MKSYQVTIFTVKIDYTWLKGLLRSLARLQSWNFRLSSLEWNKITWYSKLTAAILFIILPIAGFYLGIFYQKKITPFEFQEINQVQDQITKEEQQKRQDQKEREQKNQNLQNQDTKEEQVNKTETNKNLRQDEETQKYTFANFDRDCGKVTLIVYVFPQVSSVTSDQAKEYFGKNNIEIVEGGGSEFIIKPPEAHKTRNYWGQKIEDDKIGDVVLDNVGCDFAD